MACAFENALFLAFISSLNITGSLNFFPSLVSAIQRHQHPEKRSRTQKSGPTLMYPLNHRRLSSRTPHHKIPRSHNSSERQRNQIPERGRKGHRAVRRVCKSREKKQKSLPAEIHGEDALLQSCKGGHWQGIVADFCHDEALFFRMYNLAGAFFDSHCWEGI